MKAGDSVRWAFESHEAYRHAIHQVPDGLVHRVERASHEAAYLACKSLRIVWFTHVQVVDEPVDCMACLTAEYRP